MGEISQHGAGDRAIWVWRHPRALEAEARCIGRTDVAVDRRKAKRLARRVHRITRAAGLPLVVFTSPLQRCADVGRWLRRMGWTHRIDPALAEIDFGRWDGLPWQAIDRAEIDAWCADFANHAPGGGESLDAMFRRVAAWQASVPVVIIGHAGWMLARRWLGDARDAPATAAEWPAPPKHGEMWLISGG